MYKLFKLYTSQVAIQQRNEIEMMKGIQLKMTKDLESLKMDSSHLKKYISEHLKLLHSNENPLRTSLGRMSDPHLPFDNLFKVCGPLGELGHVEKISRQCIIWKFPGT